MADQLASPSDLASILQSGDVDASTAALLIEAATAAVQEAVGGQRILVVTADTFTLLGTTDSWLDLAQIPVTAVSSIALDGTIIDAGTDADEYRLIGNRLWRADGWQTYCNTPSAVTGVYTHGYTAGHQRLQLARSCVLSLAAGAYTAPSGGAVTSESIDDYVVRYAEAAGQMVLTTHMAAALRRQYGRRAGLIRLG